MRHFIIATSIAIAISPQTTMAGEPAYYIGVNTGAYDSMFTQGGENILGNFTNAGQYRAGSTSFGLTIGKDRAFGFYGHPVRFELELSRMTDTKFLGDSFPGYPPALFFYDTRVETTYGLANFWFDYTGADTGKWVYAFGLGAGIADQQVYTNDMIVSAKGHQTTLATMIGAQVSYNLRPDMALSLSIRHLDMGGTSSPLMFLANGMNVGTYDLYHASNEIVFSMRYYFGR